jgi:hypothetical protein
MFGKDFDFAYENNRLMLFRTEGVTIRDVTPLICPILF